MKRKIIQIDEDKCDGCGLCIPNCPEGALKIIDGKAKLVSDSFCDGLGACIGHCPKNAIKIIERDAEPYNERKVMERIVKQGKDVIEAHLKHLKEHGEKEYLNQAINYLKEKQINESELKQWPIQLTLIPPNAPYFNSELLISADCVPFAYANFHQDFLKNRSLVIGCPKLDDTEFYKEKLIEIFKSNDVKNVTVVHMEVPCCYGLLQIAEEAIKSSGKKIKLKQSVITIDGKVER